MSRSCIKSCLIEGKPSPITSQIYCWRYFHTITIIVIIAIAIAIAVVTLIAQAFLLSLSPNIQHGTLLLNAINLTSSELGHG